MKFLSDSMKDLIKDAVLIGGTAAIGFVFIQYKKNNDNKLREVTRVESEKKMNAICPSLFSVTRSSRDTLIVMKAEEVCADFILSNLK